MLIDKTVIFCYNEEKEWNGGEIVCPHMKNYLKSLRNNWKS